MKRVAVLCVGILVLAFVPAVVSAQGLLPGLPAFGGGPGACGPAGPRLFEPLTFYVGWMETLKKQAGALRIQIPGVVSEASIISTCPACGWVSNRRST